MWPRATPLVGVVLSGGLVSGCAIIPRHAGFPEVAKTVEQRTGLPLQRYGGAPAGVVADTIQELLREELTVDRAVRIALLSNRSLQATLEELGIARADVIEAGLLKNPIFSGHVRFPHKTGPTDVEFALAQAALDAFFLPLRRKLALAQFEQAKLRVSDAVLGLLAEVKTVYYRAQAADQSHAMRQTVLQAAQAAAELARRQYEAGNTRDFDFANEQVAFHEAHAALRRSQTALTEARETLNRSLGLSGDQAAQWRIAAALPKPPPTDPTLDDLETLAVSQRLDLAAARKEIEMFRRTLSLTRLGSLSTPEAGVSTETEEGDRVTGPHWEWAVPVFDWGQADLSRARARLRQREHQLAALEVAIRSEIRTLYDRLGAQRDIIETYRDHVLPLRERIITSSQRHYNYMLLGAFQLLQLKQQQVEAQQEHIEALRDYWIARTALERAVGGALPPSEVPEAVQQHQHGGRP